jgi:hypothetical protein
MNQPTDLDELMADVVGGLGDVFARMEIAEEEITAAQLRHGEPVPQRDAANRIIGVRGPIWSAFGLLDLKPASRMTDLLYRAHCRELLDRVAAGADTRPATAAEMLTAVKEVSLATPLTGAATGLYFRLFARLFPDASTDILGATGRELADYERMYGQTIDEHEAFLARKLHQPWRVAERAAPAEQLAIDMHDAHGAAA